MISHELVLTSFAAVVQAWRQANPRIPLFISFASLDVMYWPRSNCHIQYLYPFPNVFNRNILKDNVKKDDPVWQEYLDKAAVFDEHMVDEWNKIVDILLVYVGYFLLPS